MMGVNIGRAIVTIIFLAVFMLGILFVNWSITQQMDYEINFPYADQLLNPPPSFIITDNSSSRMLTLKAYNKLTASNITEEKVKDWDAMTTFVKEKLEYLTNMIFSSVFISSVFFGVGLIVPWIDYNAVRTIWRNNYLVCLCFFMFGLLIELVFHSMTVNFAVFLVFAGLGVAISSFSRTPKITVT